MVVTRSSVDGWYEDTNVREGRKRRGGEEEQEQEEKEEGGKRRPVSPFLLPLSSCLCGVVTRDWLNC